MIIFRYLSRQIMMSTIAVSTVLTMLIVSGRFIKYLSYAAAGELSPEFVFQSVAYRIPGMLVLILPLGLFLGVLLAYGRMYLESEMVVLNASGVSGRRLSMYALGPAVGIAFMVGLLGMYISPLCWKQVEVIYAKQSEKSELDSLSPGRFQSLSGGSRTSYISGIKEGGKELELIFVSERDAQSGQLRVVLAESGKQVVINPDTGDRFVVLKNGYRYEGVPGQADYHEIKYAEYGFLMPRSNGNLRPSGIESMTFSELLSKPQPRYQAELHWRLSMPLLALIITLIAVPMSKTNPRQGRYAKLIPSILLYMLYLTLLTSAKGVIDEGEASVSLLWLIHGAFFLLAMSLMFAGSAWERLLNLLPSIPQRGKA
ncbi:LPS export ABC transporter permease LptF [Neptunomonas antarctica]|uniref:Lipopolysaccharide export system permease protein LptF n=1 Tax=Neptunomonas antarctica TaxID=619304 RepID=A0A1N7P9A2_9GAMM|nr:LPS export ABC transporter permease LptF [Neptunomonas antarctica]SIT07173.1 lipopolysaccharide export system permease protein [Neptunomonas antarctica]